jgi:hypothetical protein
MNKLIAGVLCMLTFAVIATPCFADAVNGVLAEERVIQLPNDSGKWFISVVGNVNDARYNEIVGWFSTNPSLKKLRDQVRFCQVTTNTAAYRERYASNVKGLPTVRMQKPNGVVVYEAAGKNIPMTAAGLNGALANGVDKAEGIRPVLPWRRDMERRCPGPCPNPRPEPNPQPSPQPNPDPEPQPIDNGGGTPVIDESVQSQVPWVWLPVLCFVGFGVGVLCGYGRQLYQKLHPVVR